MKYICHITRFSITTKFVFMSYLCNVNLHSNSRMQFIVWTHAFVAIRWIDCRITLLLFVDKVLQWLLVLLGT